MNKSRYIAFVILVVSLTLQSCFEIKEVVSINKDGSGTFTMIIDLSQVKAMLESFGGGDSDASPFENMEREYKTTKVQLEALDGISDITFKAEMDGYVVKSGFKFANIDALNKGMDVIYEREAGNEDVPEYYSFKRRNFERTAAHNFLDQVKEELGSDEFNIQGMDIAKLFSEVAYVNEITFYGRKIKKVKSGNVKVSEDGSTATNRYYIFKDAPDQELEYKLKVK